MKGGEVLVHPTMNQDESMSVKLNEEISIAHLDDEAVILSLKSGKYYSLNETGLKMFELLQQYGSTELALPYLLKEYNADQDTLEKDMNKLIIDLKTAGLVSEI